MEIFFIAGEGKNNNNAIVSRYEDIRGESIGSGEIGVNENIGSFCAVVSSFAFVVTLDKVVVVSDDDEIRQLVDSPCMGIASLR